MQILLYSIFICNVIICVFSDNNKIKFLSLLSCIFLFFIFFHRKIKKIENYDYDQENPNALIKGKNIAGTVYSENPENVPGLGWIL